MLLEVTAKRPVPLKDRRPDLPVELTQLIMRLLEKDPDDRPDSAADVAETFAKIPRSAPRLAKPADPTKTTVRDTP